MKKDDLFLFVEALKLMATQQGADIDQETAGRLGVDFFTALPPELVLHILLHLQLKHFLPCMSVSKGWYALLSAVDPYWKQACVKLGVSGKILSGLLASHSSPKSVLYACLKHRRSICDFSPRYERLSTSYHYTVHYICQYARGQQLVGTLYRDFQPSKILIQRVGGEEVQTVLELSPTFLHIAENRIAWAHIHSKFLFCAAASGIWCVYGLDQTHSNTEPLVQWRAEPMYETGTQIACCDTCGMVCTIKLITSHTGESCWDLRVIQISKELIVSSDVKKKLPMPKVTRFRLETENREITFRRATFGKKRLALLSQSAGEKGCEFCTLHYVLSQWANEVSGFTMSCGMRRGNMVVGVSLFPVHHYTAKCNESDYDTAVMKKHGLNTSFILSEDSSLMGFIFQSCLVTWGVESLTWGEEPPEEELSHANITLDNYHFEEMNLIALGHIYSIITLEFDSSVIVLATKTGQRLLKCANFAENHSRMIPPFIALSSVEEKWLSDVTQLCGTQILYWNKSSRSIEGLRLGKPLHHDTSPTTSKGGGKKKLWPWQQKQRSAHDPP